MTTNISSIFLTALQPAHLTNETLASQTQWIQATWPGGMGNTEIKNLYSAQEKRTYRLKILQQQLRRENKINVFALSFEGE